MKTLIKNILPIFILFIGFTLTALAQDPPPPPGNPSSENPGPVGDAPIDGGLGILLALGGAYGGYKLYKYKKEQKKEEEA
jgi:hypothetical protein